MQNIDWGQVGQILGTIIVVIGGILEARRQRKRAIETSEQILNESKKQRAEAATLVATAENLDAQRQATMVQSTINLLEPLNKRVADLETQNGDLLAKADEAVKRSEDLANQIEAERLKCHHDIAQLNRLIERKDAENTELQRTVATHAEKLVKADQEKEEMRVAINTLSRQLTERLEKVEKKDTGDLPEVPKGGQP